MPPLWSKDAENSTICCKRNEKTRSKSGPQVAHREGKPPAGNHTLLGTLCSLRPVRIASTTPPCTASSLRSSRCKDKHHTLQVKHTMPITSIDAALNFVCFEGTQPCGLVYGWLMGGVGREGHGLAPELKPHHPHQTTTSTDLFHQGAQKAGDLHGMQQPQVNCCAEHAMFIEGLSNPLPATRCTHQRPRSSVTIKH